MADDIDRQIADTANQYIIQARQATGKEGPELIEQAFYKIKADRQVRCLNDVVTSSAEHYLFARYFAGSYVAKYLGPLMPLVALGVPVYDLLKLVPGPKHLLDRYGRAEKKCPLSEVDRHQTRWKELGLLDGDADAHFPRIATIRPVKPGWFR